MLRTVARYFGPSWPPGSATLESPMPTSNTATFSWCPRPTASLALKLIDYDGMYVPGLGGHAVGRDGAPELPASRTVALRHATTPTWTASRIWPSTPRCIACCCEKDPTFGNGSTTTRTCFFRSRTTSTPEKSKVFQSLWEVGGATARRTDPSARKNLIRQDWQNGVGCCGPRSYPLRFLYSRSFSWKRSCSVHRRRPSTPSRLSHPRRSWR